MGDKKAGNTPPKGTFQQQGGKLVYVPKDENRQPGKMRPGIKPAPAGPAGAPKLPPPKPKSSKAKPPPLPPGAGKKKENIDELLCGLSKPPSLPEKRKPSGPPPLPGGVPGMPPFPADRTPKPQPLPQKREPSAPTPLPGQKPAQQEPPISGVNAIDAKQQEIARRLIEGESLSQIGYEPQIGDEEGSYDSADVSLSELESERPHPPNSPVRIGPDEFEGAKPPPEGIPGMDEPFSGGSPGNVSKTEGNPFAELPDPVHTSILDGLPPAHDAAKEDRPSEDSMIPVDFDSKVPPAPSDERFSWAPAKPGNGSAIALPPELASAPPAAVQVLPQKLMENLAGVLNSLHMYDREWKLSFPENALPSLGPGGIVMAGSAEIGKYFPEKDPPHVRIYLHKIGWEDRNEQGWQKKSKQRLELFTNAPLFIALAQPKIKFISVSEKAIELAYADDENAPALGSATLPKR